MFISVVRAIERESFTIPFSEVDENGGCDLIHVAGFATGDGEDWSDDPWEQWALDILEYFRKFDTAPDYYCLLFVENIEQDLGCWFAEDGQHMKNLKENSDKIEAGLRNALDNQKRFTDRSLF